MQSKQDEGQALVSRILDQLMNNDKYGERHGAAFGLAGVVKGFGISSSKKYGIVNILQEALVDRLVLSLALEGYIPKKLGQIYCWSLKENMLQLYLCRTNLLTIVCV